MPSMKDVDIVCQIFLTGIQLTKVVMNTNLAFKRLHLALTPVERDQLSKPSNKFSAL